LVLDSGHRIKKRSVLLGREHDAFLGVQRAEAGRAGRSVHEQDFRIALVTDAVSKSVHGSPPGSASKAHFGLCDGSALRTSVGTCDLWNYRGGKLRYRCSGLHRFCGWLQTHRRSHFTFFKQKPAKRTKVINDAAALGHMNMELIEVVDGKPHRLDATRDLAVCLSLHILFDFFSGLGDDLA